MAYDGTDLHWDDVQGKASEIEPELSEILDRFSYDAAGVFNSEILLFLSFIELLNIDRVIESGRSKGHSTAVLTEFCSRRDIHVISIERDRNTKKEQIARDKVESYQNVDLRYGDARKQLPDLADEKTAILIDGPKGDQALVLATRLLDQTTVPVVAVHDLHWGKFHRDIAETVFSKHMFSDKRDYVDEFSHLDTSCWRIYDDWEPYTRDGEEIDSYGPTLGLFLNTESPLNEPSATNYLDYADRGFSDCAWFIGDRVYSLTQSTNPVVRLLSQPLWKVGKWGFNR